MDEAFLPLNKLIEKLTSINGEIRNDDLGIDSFIYEFEIDTPVELDIIKDSSGKLQIGTVPPLYSVNTSYLPSFHRIKFTAEKTITNDA